ncbi:hypothetical protein C942_00866 [Photobacterium marinum]|uniref:Uncharacterized protein n=1 Tax=Photobacterium marinum TaxID=1056511 RepID=L8JAA8_9GAMM|nr:YdbH domain-containing protein [Photobacterium marinum]ELR65780.1 hypothetical protein C942_00866 [Photobacterium marinum]
MDEAGKQQSASKKACAMQKNGDRRKNKRSRKLRLFIYCLFALLCFFVIPAIIIPPWLASKGIEINAVSGITFKQGLMIDEVSIAINNNALTLKKLRLEHFVDEESAISNSSWRLFSRQTEVRLAPVVLNALAEQGIRLSALSFVDASFNFTDLSEPYVFSAHASKLKASLFDKNDHPIKQQISNIELVLTTQPYLVITGFIRQASLKLFIPQDEAKHRYPLSFEDGNFSISWQPEKTPLSVHIATLIPDWPTVTPDYIQSGRNIALEMDLDQAAQSIKLTADQLKFEQPKFLPQFVEKPDNTNQGLHLGRAIGKLSRLPLRKLKVKDFSYGKLIINSVMVLETPHPRKDKPDKKARFKLTGKALGPDPYNIDVHLKHLNEEDAHFTGHISGPHGNSLDCRAEFHVANPLPKNLSCQLNFADTKTLTDRLNLHGIPSATLQAPLTFTAKQISMLPLSNQSKNGNTANKESSEKTESSRDSKLINMIDITQAEYQITMKLPSKVDLDLNQFAFHHPVLSPSESEKRPVSSLAFHTDGAIDLRAHFNKGVLTLNLTEQTENIAMKSPHHDSLISIQFKQLICSLRIDIPEISKSLQCHKELRFKGKLSQLFPVTNTKIETVNATTDASMQWSASDLKVQLKHTLLTLDKLTLSAHPDFINTEINELELSIPGIEISQRFEPDKPALLMLNLEPDSAIILGANAYAEKIILDDSLPEKTRKKLLQDKSRLPVQKYQAKLELELKDTSLFQSGEKLEIDTLYQVSLNLGQNDQRLPAFGSNGEISLTPRGISAKGELNNMKRAQLVQFTVISDLSQQKTRIKLHRNEIHFSPKQTLQKYYLPLLPLEYDLNNGKISFDADLVINKDKLTGHFGVFTNALSGNIHGFHFADFNAAVTAVITPGGIRTKHPISAHIGLLHAGVLLENVFAIIEFDTENNRYALHRANAYTLGGSVSTHGVTSNQLANIPEIPIIVHHLDLKKLIEAIEPEDIELTGILDGRFPVAIEDGIPVVKNGSLHSRYPGGILRYKEGSAIDKNIEAAGENSLLVISKILKNYKYDSLAVDIDYSKEGQLNASSRFKGHNPDFQNGRPVNLNLNIEDDIPALIKTLNVINSSKLESLFLKQLGLNE